MDIDLARYSCLRCRNRRSFCSKDKPKCMRCREGGFECRYEEGRRVAVNESYLRGLQAKVKAYEELLRWNRAGGKKAKPDESDEDFGGDDPDLQVLFTNLQVDSPYHKGPGAADMFVRHVHREFSEVPGVDDGLDVSPNIYDPRALPSRRIQCFRPSSGSHVQLPPPAVARRLFFAQYTYIGTIFAFADPAGFDSALAAAYTGPPDPADKDACLSYAKVLVILAFGKMYSVNQWDQGPPGFDYFRQALQLLPDAHEEGSILCVETLALIGYFMQNLNRPDAAFLYTGMALRMAISLGLHQEVAPDSLLDATERERRRRVFWSVYSLDRILCVKSGNPLTIHDEDIGVDLPSPLPTEPAAYGPAVVVRHYTVLSRILGDITQSIYRRSADGAPKSARRLMASVQAIVLALSRWERELPDQLRFDPAKLTTTRESVSTLSHYYQCVNMTARPLLFHVVRRRLRAIRADASARKQPWQTGLSTTTVRVIDMCVSAAHETVRMMAEARARNLLATYGYMDGEHVFSAAIVLVLVCAAFPSEDRSIHAMNAGLDLLRDMAERGSNSHMAARYELLAHLRSVFLPDMAAPEPEPVGVELDMAWAAGAMGLVAAQAAAAPEPVEEEQKDVKEPGANEVAEELLDLGGMVSPFTVVDNAPAFGEPDIAEMGGVDGMIWEEGFANAAVDVGDWTNWTWT
ncbi:fungal-specific transcription factor [Echria macrotheca]|uniref:Fungal-specific transcription factor n=1 Tax=Echria macrotheca TaxID=438768 RepID=A0AAJ0B4F3_9PEZI|nr:fungal-specific transcription factor [Echria macrotheca]